MAGERFNWDFKRLKISDVQPHHFPEKQQEFGHLEWKEEEEEDGGYLGYFRHTAGALINQ